MRSSTKIPELIPISPISTDVADKDQVKRTVKGSAGRIEALDFTKGVLVLFMVLYHWLIYFHGAHGIVFRYLRFLPPSFIFITGFLVSNVYLAKYQLSDPRLPKRLLVRGLKILGVFVSLNLLISLLFRGLQNLNADDLIAVFVTGNIVIAGIGKAASFQILVPIGYLLLLSALLLIICRVYSSTFYLACIVFFLGSFVLDFEGMSSNNAELIAIGLLGLILGYTPIEKIDSLSKYGYLIVIAYFCYLAAITASEPGYALQIIGVILSVAMIYTAGRASLDPSIVRRQILLLGRYPLFGYIAQIAILQILRRSLIVLDLSTLQLAGTFVTAVALTMLAVVAMDYLRDKSSVVDQIYRNVFA